MQTYRVKAGHVLPHNGEVLEAGTVVELEDQVAEDIEIAYRIEPAGADVVAPPVYRRKSDPPSAA